MNVLEIGDTEKNVGQNPATQIIENISWDAIRDGQNPKKIRSN